MACVDTDNGVTDSYGDGCADGYSGGPGIDPGDHWCSTFHGYNGYDTFESGNWNPRCMCCWCGGGTTTTDPVCLPGGGANGVWNVLGDDQTLLSGANQGDMFGYRIHLGGGGEFLVVTAPGCYKHSGDGVNPNMQLDVPTCTTPTTSKGYARACSARRGPGPTAHRESGRRSAPTPIIRGRARRGTTLGCRSPWASDACRRRDHGGRAALEGPQGSGDRRQGWPRLRLRVRSI